ESASQVRAKNWARLARTHLCIILASFGLGCQKARTNVPGSGVPLFAAEMLARQKNAITDLADSLPLGYKGLREAFRFPSRSIANSTARLGMSRLNSTRNG